MTEEKKIIATVTKTALQQRAERNKLLREQARKNRAAKGLETDPGVTFADLDQETRAQYFYDLENNHKKRLNKKSSQQFKEHQSFDRGEPTSVRTR